MFKRTLSTCGLVLFFCGCAGQANAAFYLRPELQIASMPGYGSDVGVGGALAWGGSFGREQRFEVGAEFSKIRYSGGSFDYRDMDGTGHLVTKKISSTCTITPIQAAFRYIFVTENKMVRPYLGISLGHSLVDFDGTNQNFVGHSGDCWIGSLSGGVSYQLDRRTSANLGYRYFFSDELGGGASNTYPKVAHFRYNAHVFSLAITHVFGGMRK